MAGAATLIPLFLAAASVASIPSAGWWTSPNFRLFIAIASLGLIAPANFPYFVMATFIFTVLAIFAWRYAIRAIRVRTAAAKHLKQLQALSPEHFEEWVAARLRDLGYSVKLTGMHRDHGVDLLAEKLGQVAVVQCKNYRSWAVGEPVLRDLAGAMLHFEADRAYLVTTGHLTQAALDWVQGKPIEVWDADFITRLSTRPQH